jgi:hypothetical protein
MLEREAGRWLRSALLPYRTVHASHTGTDAPRPASPKGLLDG